MRIFEKVDLEKNSSGKSVALITTFSVATLNFFKWRFYDYNIIENPIIYKFPLTKTVTYNNSMSQIIEPNKKLNT